MTQPQQPAERPPRRSALTTTAQVAQAAGNGDEDQTGPLTRAAQAAAIVLLLRAFAKWLIEARAVSTAGTQNAVLSRVQGRPGDWSAAVADSMALNAERAGQFDKVSMGRMARDVPKALEITDPALRKQALDLLVAREARYRRQHEEANFARTIAAMDRQVLHVDSPEGALWHLDPTVTEHTAGCLFMGGRFWPWSVLDRVHPARHNGCPCWLKSMNEARAIGMTDAQIVDPKRAVAIASHVHMEV